MSRPYRYTALEWETLGGIIRTSNKYGLKVISLGLFPGDEVQSVRVYQIKSGAEEH